MRSDIIPGAIFPDYELPSHAAKRRKLSELQGQHPMVLILSRGGFCPRTFGLVLDDGFIVAYPVGFDPAQESSWLPNRFCYFVLVGTSIESEHNNKMLGENERIVWAAVSERTFLCRMHMTRS